MEKQRDKAARRAERKSRELAPGVDAVPIEPFEDYLADADAKDAAGGSGADSE